MNRAQRRIAEKRGITAKDLKHEGLDATRKAVDAYSVAVAMVLYDKLHFGAPKIQMTLKQIENLFDSILKDYITIEDMKQTLEDEIGVVFVDRKET